MMMLLSLLPLLLISLIFGLYFLVKRKPTTRNRLYSGKKIMIIFYGYLTILLISTLVYYLLPETEINEDVSVIDSTNELFREGELLYEKAYAGKFDEIDTAFLKNRGSYPYDHDTLAINMTEQQVHMLVVIKHKEENDDTIEIVHYESPHRVNGVDISSEIKELEVHINNKDINFFSQYTYNEELTYTQFTTPTIFAQFSDEKNRGFGMAYNAGTQVIYLEVPKDLTVTNPTDAFIQFLK